MPLKIVLYLSILFHALYADAKQKPIILMLDPAGDQSHPGRLIQHQYERTIATSCAHTIKKELEKRSSKLLILFSRLPGEQAAQMEKAQCANQIAVDLYITLQMYQTEELKPQLHIYYYKAEPSGFMQQKSEWISFEKIHLLNAKKTKHIALHFKKNLSDQTLHRQYELHEPIGIPCKPLKGIIAPALCIELGLKTYDGWTDCLEPIIEALEKLCLHLNDI